MTSQNTFLADKCPFMLNLSVPDGPHELFSRVEQANGGTFQQSISEIPINFHNLPIFVAEIGQKEKFAPSMQLACSPFSLINYFLVPV